MGSEPNTRQMSLLLNKDELSEYVLEIFPQSRDIRWNISDLQPGEILVRMDVDDSHLRPGGTVSGPAMFSLADVTAYLVILGHIGRVPLAVTTSLNINFLSKPPEGDLLARAKLIKLGKRLAVCEIHLTNLDETSLVAQATATYSIPPR